MFATSVYSVGTPWYGYTMTENTFRITSPCHPDHGLSVEMRWDGPAYMQCQVPDGFYCDAPGCYNSWDVHGNPV